MSRDTGKINLICHSDLKNEITFSIQKTLKLLHLATDSWREMDNKQPVQRVQVRERGAVASPNRYVFKLAE